MRTMTRLLLPVLLSATAFAAEGEKPRQIDYPFYPPAPARQTQAEADRKSAGCVSCHTGSDRKTMHVTPAIVLGCTDCHGAIHGSYADPHLRR